MMSLNWFQYLWIVLFGAGVVVEGFALFNNKRNDTLSEQVWLIRTKLVGRLLLFPFWAWLTWHFFIEPATLGPQANVWWDDAIVIVIALVLGVFVSYEDYHTPALTDDDVSLEESDV